MVGLHFYIEVSGIFMLPPWVWWQEVLQCTWGTQQVLQVQRLVETDVWTEVVWFPSRHTNASSCHHNDLLVSNLSSASHFNGQRSPIKQPPVPWSVYSSMCMNLDKTIYSTNTVFIVINIKCIIRVDFTMT